MNPFHPTTAATVLIDVGTSSGAVKISDDRGPISVRIFNNGSATAWIAFGDSAVAASATTGIPVGAGAREVMRVNNNGSGALYVAAIAAGSTGKIYFTAGRGGI